MQAINVKGISNFNDLRCTQNRSRSLKGPLLHICKKNLHQIAIINSTQLSAIVTFDNKVK